MCLWPGFLLLTLYLVLSIWPFNNFLMFLHVPFTFCFHFEGLTFSLAEWPSSILSSSPDISYSTCSLLMMRLSIELFIWFKFYFSWTSAQKFYHLSNFYLHILTCSVSFNGFHFLWSSLWHLVTSSEFLGHFIIAILKSLLCMLFKSIFSENIPICGSAFGKDILCWLCVFFVPFVMVPWHLELGHWQHFLEWISALISLCGPLSICFLLSQLVMLWSMS